MVLEATLAFFGIGLSSRILPFTTFNLTWHNIIEHMIYNRLLLVAKHPQELEIP